MSSLTWPLKTAFCVQHWVSAVRNSSVKNCESIYFSTIHATKFLLLADFSKHVQLQPCMCTTLVFPPDLSTKCTICCSPEQAQGAIHLYICTYLHMQRKHNLKCSDWCLDLFLIFSYCTYNQYIYIYIYQWLHNNHNTLKNSQDNHNHEHSQNS
jgi:hypothetical protein